MDSEINDLEKFIILINQIEKSILDNKYFWKCHEFRERSKIGMVK